MFRVKRSPLSIAYYCSWKTQVPTKKATWASDCSSAGAPLDQSRWNRKVTADLCHHIWCWKNYWVLETAQLREEVYFCRLNWTSVPLKPVHGDGSGIQSLAACDGKWWKQDSSSVKIDAIRAKLAILLQSLYNERVNTKGQCRVHQQPCWWILLKQQPGRALWQDRRRLCAVHPRP